jgi:hypothetical protein
MIRKKPAPDLIRGGYGFPKRSCSIKNLKHDPEKAGPGLDPGWIPVFRNDHAPSKI